MLTKEQDEIFLFPDGSYQEYPNFTDNLNASIINKYDLIPDGEWVTDISAKYIAEFDQVDNLRRSLYFAMLTRWSQKPTSNDCREKKRKPLN